MSKSYTIDELISGYFDKQFTVADEVQLPKFSFRHRTTMKRIFKQFEQNKKKMVDSNVNDARGNILGHGQISFRNRLILVALIIVFLAVVTGFVIMFMSGGFNGTVYQNNTHLFPVDTDNCPSTIEKVYSLSVIPEGYELCEYTSNDIDVYTLYRNSKNQRLVVRQTVKSEFNIHINTEGYDLQETNVNGCDAVFIEYTNDQGVGSMVIWDNEDYIIELSGNFNKFELLNLAISNEIQNFLE